MKRLSNLVETLLALAFAGVVLITFAQVIARYVFDSSLAWSEEMARWLNITVAMIGGAIAVQRGVHMTVDIFHNRLPSSVLKAIRLLRNFLVAIFALAMGVPGWQLAMITMGIPSPSMQVPQGIAYLIMPITAALIMVYLFVDAIQVIRDVPPATEHTSGESAGLNERADER